ncbi:MAG: carotenoid biosynthesis protein [Haloarculaceae archaeon]
MDTIARSREAAHRRFQASNLVMAGVALAHALATWPLRATAALFLGGALLAFALEFVGVRAGLLRHRLSPQVASVPVSVVAAWPATVYLFYRLALLVAMGVRAAALAAVLATAVNVAVDPRMVERGAWSYPESPVSRPRYRGVPWWNFLAWLVVVFVTALFPTLAS